MLRGVPEADMAEPDIRARLFPALLGGCALAGQGVDTQSAAVLRMTDFFEVER